MKKYLLVVLLVLTATLSGGVALASSISNASFYGIIQATNNITVKSNVCVPFTANTSSWINAGILNATATNIAAHTDTGTDTAIMPGYGSNPWVVFYDSVAGYSNRNVTLYTGNVTGGKLAYFPDTAGMSVSDNPNLEPSNNFTISIRACFDMSYTGADGYFINKPGIYTVWISSSNAISADTNVTSNITVPGISSGEHTIVVNMDGSHFWMTVDSVPSTNVTATAVPDTSDKWTIGGLATSYIISCNFTKGGVLRGSWKWNLGATFPDDSSNGNTATPSFRATSSAASVNATLTSFLPVNQAVSNISANSTWGSMITAVPPQPSTIYTENATPGIFFAPIVHAIWPESGVPESFFWYSFAFAIIILAGLGVFYFFAGKGQSALLIKCIVMMAIMIFFSLPGPNIYGMYVAIYMGMFCFGVLVLSRSYGW